MNSVSIRSRNKKSSLALIYCLLAFITSSSLLYGWFPIFHSFLYICVIACFISIIVIPKFFVHRQAVWAYAYMIVIIVNSLIGDQFAFERRLLDGFILLMCASIAYYLLETNDDKCKTLVVIGVFVALIIQTVPSLVLNVANPGVLRELITLQYRDETGYDWNFLYRMGCVSYDMIHALPIFVPPIIMWLRNKNISFMWRVFLIISLACISILAL